MSRQNLVAMPHIPPTILAVSSPPGRSPRGLLRISGPDTDKILGHLLDSADASLRTLTPVRLASPPIPALLLRFQRPSSYTGEDTAELQVPGNPALLDRLLRTALETPRCDARLAEPGEFTFRAFTSGKLDLTQAEGISATIHAVSDSQLAAARLLREGRLGSAAAQFVDDLGYALALVEAGIDFTDEEDVAPISPADLSARLTSLGAKLDQLLSRSRSWGSLESLPSVVLVGRPSAGKSTLFNTLLGHERAVIDATPGTTRDVLSEPMTLSDESGRDIEAMLVDVAGLGHADCAPIESGAQSVARQAVEKADLVLHLSAPGVEPIDFASKAPRLNIQTKADLHHDSPDTSKTSLAISAVTGEGIPGLQRLIAKHIGQLGVTLSADMLALQPRHEQALREAQDAVGQTLQKLQPFLDDRHLPDIELLADRLRASLNTLAGLGGKLTPDDVIGRVFATFCVGK